MRRKKGITSIEIVVTIVMIVLATGWVINLVKFCKCDFENPYKEEVIRGVSIFVIPLGGVVGYLNIDDTKKE